MDKLKIGVYINETQNQELGGGFSYYNRLVEMINRYKFDEIIEVCFVTKIKQDKNLFLKPLLQIPYSKFISNNWTFKFKLFHRIFSISVLKYLKIHKKIRLKITKKINQDIVDFFKFNKIDLIYYLTPNLYPFEYPFIATHWDLGHKTMFSFPEVSFNNKFKKREYYHRITLQRAFAIFVESNQSKKELISYEKINENKLFIVPLFASKVVELNTDQALQIDFLNKWGLTKNKFYFYPAQFWAHKNHFGLLQAFKTVSENHPDFKLILSGSDKGNLNYIKQIVVDFGLSECVVFAGFISHDEIFTLYKNSIAIVMPTFLGPTNMPILEAYYLECAVVCSNLEGHIEQMNQNALYFDPTNHKEMANKMIEIIDYKKNIIFKKESINIGEKLNTIFLKLYNVKKTFGYEF